jgi:alpha-1,2-mannosyltransferase
LDPRALIIAAVFVYYVFYYRSFGNFILNIDHCELAFCDFQKFYYLAGKAVLEHGPLPPGFYYSNFAAILFAPLALFPLPISMVVWGVLQVAQALLLFLLPNLGLLKDKLSKGVFAFLFITSASLLHDFKWGQISLLVTLGVFGAFFLYAGRRRTWSAILLGTMIAVKFYPAIFLLYFLFKRDWKSLLVCGAAALACLVVIPILVMGLAQALSSQLFAGQSAAGLVTSLALVNTNTQYFASVIARYFNLSIASGGFRILTIAGYLAILPVLYLAWKVSKSKIENAGFWAFGLLSATIPFWIPSSWSHYFIFMPILQAMLFQEFIRRDFPARKLIFVLWLIAVLFSSILAAQAMRDWFAYVWTGLVFWSTLLTLMMTWVVLRRRLTGHVDVA